MLKDRRPEFLDDGAVIARRIIRLPDRLEDVGAMHLRQMLWNVHESVGDGTAAAAVLFQSVYNQGLRYVLAGGNPMLLRRHLEQAVQPLLARLDAMTVQLSGKEKLAGFARSLCHDSDLSEVLAEAFDMLGADGRLEIRSGHTRKLLLEFFSGTYWDGGLFSHAIAAGSASKMTLVEPALLITDLDVQEPQELLPVLELACGTGVKSLVLLAPRITDRALAVLNLPANRRHIEVAAVKTPSGPGSPWEVIEDLSRLVGGRPLLKNAGDTLQAARLENLGYARRAWADREYFGVEAGQGDPRKLRQHLANLKGALRAARTDYDVRRLQQRLGRLLPGSAVLWVGAATALALEQRKELAKRASAALRGALRDGVVPGGGVALFDLKPDLQQRIRQARDIDERAAYSILLRAVEAPIRALMSNSGHQPERLLAQIAPYPSGHGFDLVRGEVSDMLQAGIVDAVSVVKASVSSAVHSAAQALTIEALVLRADPPAGVV